MLSRKDRIAALLKSIETGDPGPIAVVDQSKYIQHNPQTHEGSEGLEVLFKRLAKTAPRVNVVRAFEDGDFVFAHTEYDFSKSNIGFEVFRFEADRAVEHWDNIQPRLGPNPSGHSMVDGPTEATDHALTEQNRRAVAGFAEDVLIGRALDRLDRYVDGARYTEHNPYMEDGEAALRAVLGARSGQGFAVVYEHCHRILAEGDFVLCVCEGSVEGAHMSFYDLFRLDGGRIVEHWDTREAVPPRSAWRNDNGKF